MLGCKGLRWRAQWPVCSWCSVLLHGVKTCCSALHVLRVSSLRFLPSTAGTRKRAYNCRGRIGRVRAGAKRMFGRCAVVGCKLFADVLAHCVLRASSRRGGSVRRCGHPPRLRFACPGLERDWLNGYFPWIGSVVLFRIVLTSPMSKW